MICQYLTTFFRATQMKKITTLAILGASLIGLTACGGSSKPKVEETKPVTAKKAVENKELKEAPAINVTDTTNPEQQGGNLVDSAKTEKRKKYVEYFNSSNEASVNGMKDIEELANDPNKDFDVAILVAPGVNGEKTKEEFLEWFNQQEHHNFTVEFTDEATLKNYNVTTNMPTPIYIDSNGNLNQTSKGRNARATNDSIKTYMNEYVK